MGRLEREGERLQVTMTKIAGAISAALAAIAVEGLVSKVIQAQRSFDVMFASLKTVTGGATQAGEAFDRLQKFASTTPYSLEQSVKGFVKLKALGLDPSERAMTSFGNTSAAMGKSLEQMIEAVADASTGEFERLKEFGIKASVQGDQVKLTFQGVTTTVKNSAADITEYLTRIGEVNFAGAMSERMKTLDGDISNLQDSLEALYLTISQSGFGDAVAAGVRKATEAISQASTSIKEGGLTEYFDGLRPYITAAEVAAVSLAGAIAGRLVAAFIASATQAYASAAAIGAATVAARGFTAVLAALGGPIGIAITGLGLLALNWEKVAGEARDAATISEQAAERIAAALRKSPGRAGADLAAQLKDVQSEVKLIDTELGRTGANRADDSQLEELRQRRAALVAVAADINRAMDSLHGGQGRGKIVPPLVSPTEPSSTTKKPEKQKTWISAIRDAAQYYKQRFLAGDKDYEGTDDFMARQREEGLRAEQRAAEQRAQLNARILADEEQFQQRMAEAGRFAADIGAEGDPVQQAVLYYQRRADALNQARAEELLSEQTHAAAIIENERLKNEALKALDNDRIEHQARRDQQSLQITGDMLSQTLDMLQRAGKERSSLAKAVFLAERAIAVATIIMNTEVAAAKAGAQLGIWGIPLAAMIRVSGYASAGLVAGQAIAEVSGGRQYGGPVSAGSMYRVNETGRPEMFVGAGGKQYLMPTTSGQVIPAEQVGGTGGMVFEFRVINQMPGAQVSQRQGADGRPELVISEVAAQIAEHRGPVWGALAGSTNVRARL